MTAIGTVTVELIHSAAHPRDPDPQVVLTEASIADLGSVGIVGNLPDGEHVLIPWGNVAMIEYHDERFNWFDR